MSTKPETRFYQSIHRLLPKGLYFEKMHNPYRGGTPDVWYSGTLDDLWAEYKWLARAPARASVKVAPLLSPLQQKWIEERFTEGRNVVVIVGSPSGALLYEGVDWQSEIAPGDAWNTKHEIADYIRRRTMIE